MRPVAFPIQKLETTKVLPTEVAVGIFAVQCCRVYIEPKLLSFMTDEGAYLDVLTNVIGEETLRAKYNQSAEV